MASMRRAHEFVARIDHARVPARLTSRFTPGDDDGRLNRDRYVMIPWLDRTRLLEGCRILEVGSGGGKSAVALAEQGALVTGIDVEPVDEARETCARHAIAATFIQANATLLASIAPPTDWVIFWASLEHMTVEERLISIADAWSILPNRGLLTVIETPNRLWPTDAHTSLLPFFNWLPDDLALRYAVRSPREAISDLAARIPDEEPVEAFLRRGRGVSYHEFDLAIGEYDVVSCLQLDTRKRNPIRRTAWALSRHGHFERLLRREAPDLHRAFFQPYLYFTIEKH